MDRIIRAVAAAALTAVLLTAGCGKKEPVPETPNTFTDTRDGQKYRTVKMPDGKTWMAQNLNYQTANDSLRYPHSYCEKYGRLYDWNTATTVCPSGWHLPSDAEWNSLFAAVGGWKTAGEKLKSKSGWNENGNGTDNYGFSALPGGDRHSDGGFDFAGYYGLWWTATEDDNGLAYYRRMLYRDDRVDEDGYDKSGGYSVRCVADRP